MFATSALSLERPDPARETSADPCHFEDVRDGSDGEAASDTCATSASTTEDGQRIRNEVQR